MHFIPLFINTASYESAEQYLMRRRHLQPPIYNARRVLEEPIPQINHEVNANDTCNNTCNNHGNNEITIKEFVTQSNENHDESNSSNEQSMEQPVELSQSKENHSATNMATEQSIELSQSNENNPATMPATELFHESEIETHVETWFEDSNACSSASIPNVIFEYTQENLCGNHCENANETNHRLFEARFEADNENKSDMQLIMEPPSSNRSELSQLLETDQIEIVDDEMTIIVSAKGYGKPYNATAEDLIKRKDDCVSGDIPFTDTVSNLENETILSIRSNSRFHQLLSTNLWNGIPGHKVAVNFMINCWWKRYF